MNTKTLMAAAVGVGLAAVAAGARAASSPAETPAPAPAAPGGPYDGLYQKFGAQYGVDWRLVKAHAIVESHEYDRAFNPEKTGADDGSYGLLQVYAVTDGAGRITNRLNIDGWPPRNVAELFDPETNVNFAVQIMASNIRAYGLPKAIAVYNAWDQHTAPAAGPFKNQGYVNSVKKAAAKLGLVI